ncbi:uncharacterized protein [Rutidosis leptorrhynchoides]|uniref:uncharacterized protein n=1 Tax=Rutidosis leptorrhynchoides TaxID=125765 RepID=UPI003A98EE93
MSTLSNSSLLLPNKHLSSGFSSNKHYLGVAKLSFGQSCISKRTSSIVARYSNDERSSDVNAFIGGFVLGGLFVGTLGCIYAPQISKALAGTDKKELLKKLPNFIYDEEKALEKTRQKLAQKIAELNSAIDDVSSQLKSDDDEPVVNGVVPDETEALA